MFYIIKTICLFFFFFVLQMHALYVPIVKRLVHLC